MMTERFSSEPGSESRVGRPARPSVDVDSAVGDVALAIPRAIDLFDAWRIDYCCEGDRSLADACATVGLSAAAALQAIDAACAASAHERDWRAERLIDLIAHVRETHHRFTKKQTVRLAALAEATREEGALVGVDFEPLYRVCRRLAETERMHMKVEEDVLFPYVEALERARHARGPLPTCPFGRLVDALRVMRHEHASIGHMLAELRGLASEATILKKPGELLLECLCGLARDLRRHMHLESRVLFARALLLESSS